MSEISSEQSKVEDSLTGRLQILTLSTSDLESVRKFYVDGLSMEISGPIEQAPEILERQKTVWGIEPEVSYDYYHLQPTKEDQMHIRLLHLQGEVSPMYEAHNARQLGPYSIGFKCRSQKKADKRLDKMGFLTNAHSVSREMTDEDGSAYTYQKSIIRAPDFVHGVVVEMKKADKDEKPNIIGPEYATIITDKANEDLDFFTLVLGHEIGIDLYKATSADNALGIEEGVPYRISTIYSNNERSSHATLIEYQDEQFVEPLQPTRLPHPGMGMWSFKTRDIGEVLARAHAKTVKVFRTPRKINDPIVGDCISMTLLTPGGFLVEVYNQL